MRRFLAASLLALSVRLPFAVPFFLGRAPLPATPDAQGYWRLAANLREGRGFSMDPAPPYNPDPLRTPGWPLALSLAANPEAGLALNLLLSSLTAGVLALAGGLWVGVLWAFNPLSVAWSLDLMSESLFCLLLALALWALRRRENWAGWLGGALLGLAALTRPVALFLPLVALPFLRGKRLGVSLSFLALVAPWFLRNWITFGDFFFSGVSRVNIAYWGIGLEAKREGVGLAEARARFVERLEKKYGWNLLEEVDPWEGLRRWKLAASESLRLIASDPLGFAQLHLLNTLKMLFPIHPRTLQTLYGVEERGLTGWSKAFLAYALLYQLALYLLAAMGFLQRREPFLAATALYFVLLPGWPLPRLRLPADLALAWIAGKLKSNN